MIELFIILGLIDRLLQVSNRQLRQKGIVVGYVFITLPEAVAFSDEHMKRVRVVNSPERKMDGEDDIIDPLC